MPVNRKMMANMKREYGAKKGERVYYAMEQKMKKTKYHGSGPFSKAEEEKGFKVLCSSTDLAKMNVDKVEYAGPTLAKRVDPKTAKRYKSTKGSY